MICEFFYELIQVALGHRERLGRNPSDQEWRWLFQTCQKQAVAAFVFPAIERLSAAGQKPPVDLVYEWIAVSEQVRTQNSVMNKEAVRLTSLFEKAGHRTVILKGQANARLYPNPSSRQPGDIDIWIDGGQERVVHTLRKLGLLEGEIGKFTCDGGTTLSYHHIHIEKKEKDIDVEVHFRPSSGNRNPFTNRKLQSFLENELNQENKLVAEGFRVPSIRFALVMQLAHIQRHLISEGIGIRQIIDYYYLLMEYERGKKQDISHHTSYIKHHWGLSHTAGALMWVLHEMLGLHEQYLIAPIDEKRGKMMLQAIMEGGNFGRHHQGKLHGLGQRIITKNKHRLKMLRFDFWEALWHEVDYLLFILQTIPARISRRKWSLE